MGSGRTDSRRSGDSQADKERPTVVINRLRLSMGVLFAGHSAGSGCLPVNGPMSGMSRVDDAPAFPGQGEPVAVAWVAVVPRLVCGGRGSGYRRE